MVVDGGWNVVAAKFGTPLDITVDELAIESFFPADPDTVAVLGTGRAATSSAGG
jgi:hypothetical protein